MTAEDRAHSVHLMVRVLGSTWYTNLSPGQITLQSPEAGQRVQFEATIGVELAINAPEWLAPESLNHERECSGSRQSFAQETIYAPTYRGTSFNGYGSSRRGL